MTQRRILRLHDPTRNAKHVADGTGIDARGANGAMDEVVRDRNESVPRPGRFN
jgi:hypothetical protein